MLVFRFVLGLLFVIFLLLLLLLSRRDDEDWMMAGWRLWVWSHLWVGLLCLAGGLGGVLDTLVGKGPSADGCRLECKGSLRESVSGD